MIGFLIFMAPALLLALFASMITKSTFGRYSRVGSSRGYTGAEAAAEMLRRSGIHDCTIEPIRGRLTDHYDPSSKTLRLSEEVYGSPSLAAIGVACHEAGHAIQHAHAYSFLALRSTLVPMTNICSNFYWIVFLVGAMGQIPALMWLAVGMLFVGVLFAVVTLPVEWDASRRAKLAMVDVGLLDREETEHAGKVLNAAFLTYLAGAVSAILTLLYYLLPLLNRD